MEDETSGELLEMESAHTNEITNLSEFSGQKISVILFQEIQPS